MNAKPLPPNPYNAMSWVTGVPKIGKGTWIGAFCLIDGLGGLTIGKGCDISCGAHIVTHSTVKRCISERQYPILDKAATRIGSYVFIGENATILMGCTIGHHSVIAAGAVVKQGTKIPPYSLVAGVPGRIVKNLKKTVAELKKNGISKTTKRKK
jgi:acetyltransferase-like isoleucine patch superfamily enzyme